MDLSHSYAKIIYFCFPPPKKRTAPGFYGIQWLFLLSRRFSYMGHSFSYVLCRKNYIRHNSNYIRPFFAHLQRTEKQNVAMEITDMVILLSFSVLRTF